jgi:ATP-dependent 26S proteasome regulatory subunit
MVRLNKKASEKTKPPILMDGVLEEVVENTVGFLLRSKEIESYGVTVKRGIILDGEPGNGKTMMCRYIQKLCSQNNISWGVVTSADIDGAYEDKELDSLFRMYTVTFFDDIDVGYMDRKRGNGKMACSLLTAMDGMNTEGHLVRIFTTNEPVGELDAAFTRPGRIDKAITLTRPDADLRRKLVQQVWPKEIQDAINIDELIERSEGYSFAELEAIRTFLVTNKIFADNGWDLDEAFDEFDSRRAEKKRKGTKRVGFGTTKK